jgi:hypothetical protein
MDSLSPKKTPPASPKVINPSQLKPEGLLGKATEGVKGFTQASHEPIANAQGQPLSLREILYAPTHPLDIARLTEDQKITLFKEGQEAMMDTALSVEDRVASVKLLFKLRPKETLDILRDDLSIFITNAHEPQKEHLEFFEALGNQLGELSEGDFRPMVEVILQVILLKLDAKAPPNNGPLSLNRLLNTLLVNLKEDTLTEMIKNELSNANANYFKDKPYEVLEEIMNKINDQKDHEKIDLIVRRCEALIEVCLNDTFNKPPSTIENVMDAIFAFDEDFYQLPLSLQERFVRFFGENLLHPMLDQPTHSYIRQYIRNFLGECSTYYSANDHIAILAKQFKKEDASLDVVESLLQSQDEPQFQKKFEEIEWVFPSRRECRKAFFALAKSLTFPYEPWHTNAKRLLAAFQERGIYTFSCNINYSPNHWQSASTGAAILELLNIFIEIDNSSDRSDYLELIHPFVAEAFKNNPSIIFEKTTDAANENYWCGDQIVLSCEVSNIPPSEWQESLDFILQPYWKPFEKIFIWGNWYPLKFKKFQQGLLNRLNAGAGYASTTQSWLQNFFQEKSLLDQLYANPAYAKIWNKTKPLISELIRSFGGSGRDPKSLVATASSIDEKGQATAIGINVPRHLMSMSVINDDLCLINNYGGAFDLKEGKLGSNCLPGTLILKLKDGKNLTETWTEDQIQGLKSCLTSPEKFHPAIDKIFENYDVVGAYDARGQTRGNCNAKHNFLHVFNALMATAYNIKGEADSILDEFKDTLPHEKDTHSQRWYPEAKTIEIRGQEVPFCNNDLVQMASRCYRDVTLLMRIQCLLDVVNDPEGIQKLVQMMQPDDPESLVEDFRTNIRTTTEGLVRLFKKRLVNQSAANKGLKLHEVGLNTLHQKDGKPFALVPYILENLNPDSEFSAIVREVLTKG